ncbi:hypothetical protein BZG02_20565 [Labilibaculum filiforme]|uniref:Uncharacterized protein n=1 Tax=Labilibaculum filiforme TaxID=1940526 RepID=A0A2N3HQ24_9BACT|nr:hypothetical protein [Labilibaculum filiforme]PKQ60151.1 hypothetical protein BZG02_20565 [Labilibaculum filiforme]
MSDSLRDIAIQINQMSNDYEIGNLQDIRKDLKGLKKKANSNIFVDDSKTMTDDWAFHYGGRSELQYNIGFEDEGFRYGLAFSLETSQTLPDINLLRPKIKKLNTLIQEKPNVFSDYNMWYWQGGVRSDIFDVRKIDSELIQNGTFIFFGKLIEKDKLNYNEILQTFDNLLPIYKDVETKELTTQTQLTKTCVLKPIMWNTDNYKGPSGFQSAGGFSKDNGYGHEEWNNDDNWVWRNFKVFHTESKPKLLEYSNDGNLGIVMIASFEKKQYAVGIATNVYHNDIDERKLIASELNNYENHHQVWQQGTVKRAFDNDKESFLEHWKKNYTWVQWKCPTENYCWFEKPVLLNPQDFSGKDKLISMHGSYQRVLPQLVLETLSDNFADKPQIIDWLTTGEFDTDWVDSDTKVKSNTKLRKRYSSSGANAPASRAFSYWINGQRNIEPLHAKLQALFVDYLSKRGVDYIENQDYIDVQYTQGDISYYCEIKPTKNMDTKYAIRIAVGQLLEYRYFNNKNAKLEIVISSKPRDKELEFVKSLDMKLTYLDDLTNEFITN